MAKQQLEQRTVAPPARRRFRPVHTLGVVALGVVGVVVAFWALAFVAGIVWGLVKVAVLVALIGGTVWFLLRRRR